MTRPRTASTGPGPQAAPAVLAAADYGRLAAAVLPAPTFAYIEGGAGAGLTARRNRQGFARWAIQPRLLRDLGAGHTVRLIAGQTFAHPILLAPVAYQALVHPDRELASAQAARATDTRMVLSTLATTRLEEVARAGGAGHWFQLYLQPDPKATVRLAQRARDAGYAALVVTLDATIQVAGHAALRAGFVLPPQCVAVNLDAVASSAPPAAGPPAAPGASRVFQGLMRAAPRIADLEALMQATDLPVWVKGVMTPADALALRALGVRGLVVSNHGGRTLDGVPASLDVLPAIRAALGPDYPLLFDGGIRSGADVFKALALGAQAILLGRLPLHALAVGGAIGVGHLLNLLREELELCMAQAGCASLDEIGPDCLLRLDGAGFGSDGEASDGTPSDDGWLQGVEAPRGRGDGPC